MKHNPTSLAFIFLAVFTRACTLILYGGIIAVIISLQRAEHKYQPYTAPADQNTPHWPHQQPGMIQNLNGAYPPQPVQSAPYLSPVNTPAASDHRTEGHSPVSPVSRGNDTDQYPNRINQPVSGEHSTHPSPHGMTSPPPGGIY